MRHAARLPGLAPARKTWTRRYTGGSMQSRMPFAYFQRLTRRQQAIYLESDGIVTMAAAAGGPAPAAS